MRLMSVFLLAVSLLFLQISGLHLHVSAEAVEGVHGAHGGHYDSHMLGGSVDDTEHSDHADESDVSLFELGGSSAKVLSFLILLVACLVAVMSPGRLVFAPRLRSLKPRPNFRWRPPLRGPPVPAR